MPAEHALVVYRPTDCGPTADTRTTVAWSAEPGDLY